MLKSLKILFVIAILVVIGLYFLDKKVLNNVNYSPQNLVRSTPFPTLSEEQVLTAFSSPAGGYEFNLKSFYTIEENTAKQSEDLGSLVINNRKSNSKIGTIRILESSNYENINTELKSKPNTYFIVENTNGNNNTYLYNELNGDNISASYVLVVNPKFNKLAYITGDNNGNWANFQNDFNDIVQSFNFFQ